MCICIFLQLKNKFIIFSGTTSEALKTGAMFLLTNHFIKDHANKNYILDFAGSNIKGIAERNKGFGATEYKYISLHYNSLPKIIQKLLHKK